MANLINVIALSNIKSIFVCIVSLGITILCMTCVCVYLYKVCPGICLYSLVFVCVCVHQLFRLIYTSIEFVILSLSIQEPAGFHPLHKE